MPTLDEVMDNIGEPMDFAEYRLDDEEEGQEDEGNCERKECADANIESANIAGPSGTMHADLDEAGPSGSGDGSRDSDAAVGIIDITGSGILDEACFSSLEYLYCILQADMMSQLRPSLNLIV